MGYFNSLMQYMKTEKAKHDFIDYLRAIVIIAATMAMVRVVVDIFL